MDITLMYTPEEKKAFEEEQEAHFFMEKKKEEYAELNSEWNSHTSGNHTDLYSPVVFSVLAGIAWFSLIFFFRSPFPFWAIVTATPFIALGFTGLAIFFWIRYAKQLKAYTTREEELDVKRKRAFREFESAKEKYTEKLKIVEAITYRKHQDKRKAEEAAMDPKRFEALFHSEDEKKAP